MSGLGQEEGEGDRGGRGSEKEAGGGGEPPEESEEGGLLRPRRELTSKPDFFLAAVGDLEEELFDNGWFPGLP